MNILKVVSIAPPDLKGGGIRAYYISKYISINTKHSILFLTYSKTLGFDNFNVIRNLQSNKFYLKPIFFIFNLFFNVYKLNKEKIDVVYFNGFGLISLNTLLVLKILRKKVKYFYSSTQSNYDDYNGLQKTFLKRFYLRIITKNKFNLISMSGSI